MEIEARYPEALRYVRDRYGLGFWDLIERPGECEVRYCGFTIRYLIFGTGKILII